MNTDKPMKQQSPSPTTLITNMNNSYRAMSVAYTKCGDSPTDIHQFNQQNVNNQTNNIHCMNTLNKNE